uniref:Uncharacterized protein n=1 Tax=Salix viminalis TaxID=40686 RepID=A0A6N2JXM1_SALVM
METVFSRQKHHAVSNYLSSLNLHPRTHTQISIICVWRYSISFLHLDFSGEANRPNEEPRKELHLLYTISILAYKAEYSVSYLVIFRYGGLECYWNVVMSSTNESYL